MEGFDWGTLIAAAGGLVVGLVAAFYGTFRKAAKADDVQNWKDEVGKAVDGLAEKIDGQNKA
jgi:hypothetical protein